MTQKDNKRHCNICNSDYHTTEGHTDSRMFGEETLAEVEKMIDEMRLRTRRWRDFKEVIEVTALLDELQKLKEKK